MSLMDAKEYDPRPAQRRKRLIGTGVLVIVIFLIFWFWPDGRFRYWRAWHRADTFLIALQNKDFDKAYGIYNGDPDWKQHPQKYDRYSQSQFILDWGPSSEFGPITHHSIDCATEPPKKGFAIPSGVIVVATINRRAKSTSLWVEKRSGSVSESPQEVLCHTP
ncbi:MAG TPA: hypothetical protein VHN74_05330 [Candidatus Angelobacter sp.]|jgi:hypothetical protein|nr:hypothetical protein [Candidatus Angelobacter sp.]